MENARIESSYSKFAPLLTERTDEHIEDFFRNIFGMFMAWANSARPINISRFEVPSEIAGLMKIRSCELEVKRNYLSFGIDPVFEIESLEQIRQEKSHPTVMAENEE